MKIYGATLLYLQFRFLWVFWSVDKYIWRFKVCHTRELRVYSNVTRWIQNCLRNVNHTSLIVLNSLHDKSIHVNSIGLNIRLSSAAGNPVMSFNMLLFSFNDVPWYLSSCPERSGFFPGSISRASSLGSSDVEYVSISLLAHQVLSCARNIIDHSWKMFVGQCCSHRI